MPSISSKVLSVSRLHGILYPHGRHFRLQKGGRWVEDKNPLPPSETIIYTGVSIDLVEDGRQQYNFFSGAITC